jgi:magnesium transporter
LIRSFYYLPGESVSVIEGVTDFDRMVKKDGSVLWVDMCRPTDEESFVLTHDFNFHPLAIEDVLSEKARSKIDDYDSYLFVVFQLADYVGREEELKVGEVDLFLSKRSMVTVHYDDHRIFDYLYHRAERDERLVSRGADFLFHAVIDTMVDNYNTTLDIIEYDVDEIERDILGGEPDEETLRSVFTLRRDIVQLKRIVLPQTEVLTRLSRGEFDLISQKAAVYFSDVHDHLARMNDIADSQREILNSSLEVYFSSVSTKTNEIIKFLTIVTVLFMPPTFLVGLWGMNFHNMPELTWEYGYEVALVLMMVITFGLIFYFRKKKWL